MNMKNMLNIDSIDDFFDNDNNSFEENTYYEGSVDILKDAIESWIKNNCKIEMPGTYNINDDYSIDVDGDVFLIPDSSSNNIEELPNFIQFNIVSGAFVISSYPKLKTLRGCPKEVRIFNCSYLYSIKNLKYCPKRVHKHFYCNNCISLESLEGTPKIINGDFTCTNNTSLKNLIGAPSVIKGSFDCSDCKALTSLSGTIQRIGIDLYCNRCPQLRATGRIPNVGRKIQSYGSPNFIIEKKNDFKEMMKNMARGKLIH